MIKLLILILLGFVGYSMLQALIRPRPQSKDKKSSSRNRNGEQMVEDPQCGTFIPLGDAVPAKINGQQYYFCSKECLKEFKKKH